jgi:hypothetical protein
MVTPASSHHHHDDDAGNHSQKRAPVFGSQMFLFENTFFFQHARFVSWLKETSPCESS